MYNKINNWLLGIDVNYGIGFCFLSLPHSVSGFWWSPICHCHRPSNSLHRRDHKAMEKKKSHSHNHWIFLTKRHKLTTIQKPWPYRKTKCPIENPSLETRRLSLIGNHSIFSTRYATLISTQYIVLFHRDKILSDEESFPNIALKKFF